MFLKAPFALPSDFLRTFGYPGSRRFVALYWTSFGDEACFDDGQRSACGLGDNWAYLGFVRRKDVWAWREENGIHLGNSEEEAKHWLVVDAETGEVFTALWREARQAVIWQEIPA